MVVVVLASVVASFELHEAVPLVFGRRKLREEGGEGNFVI
jgi:hypothetical protein